jgi:hypothetical protein
MSCRTSARHQRLHDRAGLFDGAAGSALSAGIARVPRPGTSNMGWPGLPAEVVAASVVISAVLGGTG